MKTFLPSITFGHLLICIYALRLHPLFLGPDKIHLRSSFPSKINPQINSRAGKSSSSTVQSGQVICPRDHLGFVGLFPACFCWDPLQQPLYTSYFTLVFCNCTDLLFLGIGTTLILSLPLSCLCRPPCPLFSYKLFHGIPVPPQNPHPGYLPQSFPFWQGSLPFPFFFRSHSKKGEQIAFKTQLNVVITTGVACHLVDQWESSN